jgi:DNA adenine methylase
MIRSFMGFGSAAVTEMRPNGRIMTGFRPCSNRSGTTPAHDWSALPAHLDSFIERLRGVVIENRDACAMMRQHDSAETLFYVDPPYVAVTRDAGPDYAFEMTEGDHEKLAECLHSLKGMVMLSGYESPLYDRLFKGWHKETKAAYADGARKRTEVLWFRNINPQTLDLFAA